MRVLVVSHSCVIAVNQQVFAELEKLNNNELALVVPDKWQSEYANELIYPAKLSNTRFQFWPIPVQKAGSISLHFYPRLPWKEINAFKPDIVLSQQEPYSLSGAQALWVAQRLGVPFLFQTNQNIVKQYPPPFGWIEKWHMNKAACVLAYSEEAAQVMRQKGREGDVAVVPYATDISRFQPRTSNALREQLAIGNAICLGYIGRLIPEKGLDDFLRAAALLKQKPGLPFKVLFVGSGSHKEALQTLVTELKLNETVVFVDAVPHAEVAKYMACLDVFVLPSRTTPSWKEQFGRVIIESLACGVPVVGSDSGAIPHLIRATTGGLVFDEGNADSLASCLDILINDSTKRSVLGEGGLRAVQEHFSCEAVARSVNGLLVKAISDKASPSEARGTAT